MRSAAPVVLAMLLAGCALTKSDPEKPELPLPEALPAVTDALPSLPAPWWQVFEDPTLDALIREALERNPDIDVAASRVAEARAIANAVRADRLEWAGLLKNHDSTKFVVQGAVQLPAQHEGVCHLSTLGSDELNFFR